MRNVFDICHDFAVIYLTRRDGMVLKTIIDVADLPKAQSIGGMWFACWDPGTSSFRVCGALIDSSGKRKMVWLHRFLVNAPAGFDVDHFDHDQLNNRRINLRIITHKENSQNRLRANKNNISSGILGVSWSKKHNRWISKIVVSGEQIFLGQFKNKEDAAIAVVNARARLMPYSREASS